MIELTKSLTCRNLETELGLPEGSIRSIVRHNDTLVVDTDTVLTAEQQAILENITTTFRMV